jgi:hypothetical protein
MKLDQSRILFSPEDEDLLSFQWHLSTKGYARRNTWDKGTKKKGHETAHLIVMERMHGIRPSPSENGLETDHKDRNRLNNRRDNLRLATSSINQQNRGHGPFRGTRWERAWKKWRATVRFKGQEFHCGAFDDRAEAAEAARLKRKELRFVEESWRITS